MNKITNRRILILLIFVSAIGIAIIWWVANSAGKHMRVELLTQARIAAQAINIKYVASLTGSENDLEKPAYQRIKNQMALMRNAIKKCKFLYLMGQRSDGVVFFFADSLPPDDKDYAPPGLVYDEVSDSYRRIFKINDEAVVGPVTDRWGTLITALVPLRDPYKGNVIAVLGMDVDANYWNKEILSRCFFPFTVMLLFVFLILLLVSREKVAKTLRQSENKLRTTLDATPFPVAVVDLNDDKIFFWSQSALELFGHTAPTASEWYQIAYPDPVYRHEVIERWKPFLEIACESGQPVNTGEYRVTCKDGYERICELYITCLPEQMIVTFNDITERKRAQAELLRRSEFEQLVAKISSELAGMNSDSVDSVIDRALSSIGAFTGADRAYVFQFKNIGTQVDNTHEWCADGVEPQIKNLKNIPIAEELPWFFEQLRKLEVFHEPEVGALPSEARLEREHFETQNIKSLVVIPMKTMGNLTGFIGFDATSEYRTWSDDDQSLLQFIGKTISHVIERNRGEEERKKADDEIIKQKRLFETMFNTIPDGVVITNTKREIQLANKGMKNTFGYKPEELIGKETKILYATQDKFNETGKNVFGEDAKKPGDLYITHYKNKNGREFFGETFGAKLYDDDNQWIGNLGIMRDITERKQAEVSLRESEEKFRNFSEQSLVGIYLIQDSVFKYVNPKFANIFGYTVEECMNNMNFRKLVHSDDLALVKKQIRSRESGEATSLQYGFRGIKKNGEIIDVEIFGSSISYKDKIVVTGTMLDITEPKQAIEALRKSEENYKVLAENPNSIVMRFDPKGNIIFVNQYACQLFGYSFKEMMGKKSTDLIHPEIQDDGQRAEDLFANVLNHPERFQTNENVNLTKDGKRLWISWANTPTYDESGQLTGLICTGFDTTDKKHMEKQLQQTQKMESIGTLAGGIAHDFNNILSPIVGYTEMLLEDIPEDSPYRGNLTGIYTSALRAKELVKQILTFSRQGSGESILMKMQPIVKEALKLIRSTIPTTIEIIQDINPDCGVIKADPTQIHQIVMNLATNAYHAMEENGGKLKVSLKEIEFRTLDLINPNMAPGIYACLTVADTGVGMDKNVTDKIFDPFFTTKAIGKGTGMGLSVVHGIVTAMGGAIHVYSEPGKGTEFHVYLPVEKSLSQEQATTSKAQIQGGTEQILLVDDEQAILTMEKRMLERLGYQVTSLSSSLEALEAFRANSNKFDLVITDMAMPHMPGDRLSVEVTKIRPGIPILLCTGFSENMSEERAASLGIKGFLLKPIVMKDLAQKIREVLDENSDCRIENYSGKGVLDG